MNKTISIRLTEERADLLSRAKRYFKVKKDTDVIDLALKTSLKTEFDYDSKLKSVLGCIKLTGKGSATQTIRALRDGNDYNG